ncbi:MAG: hypothetical protein R2753_17480 [Chitinophagales bacterium]
MGLLIYRYNGVNWVAEQKLIASDGASGDAFGSAVAISGNWAIVGAIFDDDIVNSSGSAYLYFYNGSTWTEFQKITASNPGFNNKFGFSVSISGNFAVVGANTAGGPFLSTGGAAYVFQYNGSIWEQIQIVQPADIQTLDNFGFSVDIVGDKFVVGSNVDDDNGNASGSAYVYKYNGSIFIQEQKLTAIDGAANDQYGVSVAIGKDIIVVGANLDDSPATDAGSIYIYDFNGSSWVHNLKIAATDQNSSDNLGTTVSISNKRIIAGSGYDDAPLPNSGSIYIYNFDGSTWEEGIKVTASDANSNDFYGNSASISGEWIVTGAAFNDDFASSTGSAYFIKAAPADIYSPQAIDACDSVQINGIWYSESQIVRDTFAIDACQDSIVVTELNLSSNCEVTELCEIQRIFASDPGVNDDYGDAISIYGDLAIVGVQLNDDGGTSSGSAYILRKSGGVWTQETKLVAFDDAADDRFGIDVAIAENIAIVGAPLDDDDGANSGSVYIYKYNGSTWNLDIKLVAFDATAGDQFGISVDLSGNTLVVGASSDDDGASNNGSVYIYNYDGTNWNFTQKVDPTINIVNGYFGSSIDLSGDRMIVGATWPLSIGAAHIFDFNGTSWVETQRLLASDGGTADNFGGTVSLSGNFAVIGASSDDDLGTNSGSAYVFEFNGSSWSQINKFLPTDPPNSIDLFGSSVTIEANKMLIGCPGEDGPNSGAVYFYQYDGSTWSFTEKILAVATSGNLGSAVDISGDNFMLGASETPTGGAVFFYEACLPDVVIYEDRAACDSVQIGGTWYAENALVYDTISGSLTDSIYIINLEIEDCNASVFCTFNQVLSNDDDAVDYFGVSFAVFENTAVVGARLDDENGANAGAAYVFNYDGTNWVQAQKILPGDVIAGDLFGSDVAIYNDVMAISQIGSLNDVADFRSVYIYRYNGSSWVQEQKIAPYGNSADYFGRNWKFMEII